MKHHWPQGLGLDPGAVKALEKCLDVPIPGNWPEGVAFVTADQPYEIATVLCPAWHKELTNARIAFLFKEKSTERSRATAGKAFLLSKRERYLSDYDFAIVIDHSIWTAMDLVARTALVDHELEHCGVDDGGNFITIPHDIQEFNTTVGRWGAWHQGVQDFFRAAKPQFEMWTEPEPEPAVQLEK